MKKMFFLVLFIFLAFFNHLTSATAVFVPYKCPPGSPEKDGWYVYEDRNGNGYYDRLTTKHCDGSVTVVDIPELIGGFRDTIGNAPEYLNSVIYDFSTYSCEGCSKAAWHVIVKDSASLDEVYRVVCCGDNYQLIIPEKISAIKGDFDNLFSLTEHIRIYPNPTSDEMNIKISELLSGILYVDIINIKGDKVVSYELLLNGRTEFAMDISFLLNGNYYVKIMNGASSAFIPLAIMR